MAHLCGFCAETFLLAAIVAGSCFAGFPIPEKDRATRIKLPIQTVKQAAGPSYGPPACTPGIPQIPNYIQPMKIDPARVMGKWYLYEEWYDGISDTRTSVNIATTFTNLLNGSLTLFPGSNTQAIAMEQLSSAFQLATNQCNTVTLSYLDHLTVDGQQRGFGFFRGEAALDTSLALAIDYEEFAIFVECLKYSINTDICLDPHPYVFARERPDKISAATANNIASAVNRTLGPYCFTTDMMIKYPWINDMPDCPFRPQTDTCYISLRNAYLYLGDPNFFAI